ncbi:MAG: VWA domain-containing protein [Fimbriimonadia bacterium]
MRRWLSIMLGLMSVACWSQGTLIPREIRPPIPDSWGPWVLQSHRVEVGIRDGVAETRVEQVFLNKGTRPLEADYLFPIPASANISRLSMTDGDKLMEAKIMPADEARRIYESIVRGLRDPALLELAGNRLVRLRIFPIPPQGTRRIQLTYSETMQREGGAYRYVYPFRMDARSEGAPDLVTLRADISSSQPLQTVTSPSHPTAAIRVESASRATVSWESGRPYQPVDFQLLIRSGSENLGLSAMTYRTFGDGFFLLFLSPRLHAPEAEIPKNVVFVFDRTGSMSGQKIVQARTALRYCLEKLRPMDRFKVIAFDDSPDALFRGTVEATRANIEKAIRFAESMEARGGTNILAALDAALDALSTSTGPFDAIVFLTDGQPTVGETDPKRIADKIADRNQELKHIINHAPVPGAPEKQERRPARVRIYSFGVGRDVNSRLLNRLSMDSGGDDNYVTEGEAIEPVVAGFFEKVSVPALRDVRITYEGMDAYDIFPREQRDLFRGSALVIAGRYRGTGSGRIMVTGRGASGEEKVELRLDLGGRHDRDDFIPRIWATRKIGYLLTELNGSGRSSELEKEIVRLSLEYGIVTPLTAFLIADDGPVPQMWRARRAWGEDIRAPEGMRELDAEMERSADAYRKGTTQRLGQWVGRTEQHADAAPMSKAYGGGYQVGGPKGAEGIAQAGPMVQGQARWEARSQRQQGGVYAADKTFYQAGNAMVDSMLQPGDKLVEVQAFSRAHIQLIERYRKLASYSQVGDTVVVQLPGGAVRIGSTGAEELSEEELKRLIPPEYVQTSLEYPDHPGVPLAPLIASASAASIGATLLHLRLRA